MWFLLSNLLYFWFRGSVLPSVPTLYAGALARADSQRVSGTNSINSTLFGPFVILC